MLQFMGSQRVRHDWVTELTDWLDWSSGFHDGSDGKESSINVGHLSSIPGWGSSPGGGYGNSLKYSCLENPYGQEFAGLQSLGSQRVGHDWQIKHSTVQVFHIFPSKEQVSFNFMAAVTVQSDFGAQENKIGHCFLFSLIYLLWSDGTRCHNLSFLNI